MGTEVPSRSGPQLYRVVKKAVPWPTGVFQEDKVLYRERVGGVSLPPRSSWLQEDSLRTFLCPSHLLWRPSVSPLPCLLRLPELIDDKGEAIREPHGSDAATGDRQAGRLGLNRGHPRPVAHHYTQPLPSTFLVRQRDSTGCPHHLE